jgi:large subunit ribosomal protein L10
MALTRQKKQQQVERLAGELKDSTSAIVGTFAKLTVAQDFALRRKVREAGGKYRVLKNKLAQRASAGTQVEAALKGLKGVSSVAYTSGDPVALAKALSAWVKDNAEFSFKLAIVDGKVISVDEIQELAKMPGKEELFAKLLMLINAPAQRLVTVISATGRDLAIVMDQAVKENKLGGGAAAAAAEAKAEAPAAEAPKAEAATTAPAAGTSTDPVEGATAEESAAPVETAEVAPEKQAEAAATEAPAEGAAEPAS